MTFTALIADDEPLARRTMRDFLAGVDWIACIAETADGPSTIRAVDDLTPDVLFLDVRMPGASGLDVLERVAHRPHVVFTTAYDRYAVTAFELRALDYLLKPFGAERFHRTLERVREALSLTAAAAPSLLQRTRDGAPDGSLGRVFVRERGRILPVAARDIERLEGVDDYVTVHAGGRCHLVSVRLRDFEARLDPARFVRVHRSHIVNLDHVAALERCDGARLQVVMRDGAVIPASRNRSRALRERLRGLDV